MTMMTKRRKRTTLIVLVTKTVIIIMTITTTTTIFWYDYHDVESELLPNSNRYIRYLLHEMAVRLIVKEVNHGPANVKSVLAYRNTHLECDLGLS